MTWFNLVARQAQLTEAYAIRDDVGVAVQTPLWVSVRLLVACEVPDDQSLVSGSGQKHARARTVLALHSNGEERGPSKSHFSDEVARLVTQPL
jgi:hypothetical protein